MYTNRNALKEPDLLPLSPQDSEQQTLQPISFKITVFLKLGAFTHFSRKHCRWTRIVALASANMQVTTPPRPCITDISGTPAQTKT